MSHRRSLSWSAWFEVALDILCLFLHTSATSMLQSSLFSYCSLLGTEDNFYSYLMSAATIFTFIGYMFMGASADQSQKEKFVIIIGLLVCALAGVLFASIDIMPSVYRTMTISVSRCLLGAGSGFTSLLYRHSGKVSGEMIGKTVALTTGITSFGNVLNFELSKMFAKLGYPGQEIFGFRLHRFNVVGLYVMVVYIVCTVLVIKFFHEDSPTKKKHRSEDKGTRKSWSPLSWILVCIIRLLQAFVTSNMDAIFAKFVTVMYGLTPSEVADYQAELIAGMGSVSILMAVVNFCLPCLAKLEWTRCKLICIASPVFMASYYVLTLTRDSWLFGTGDVDTAKNNCFVLGYTWCDTIMPMSWAWFSGLYFCLFSTSYVILTSAVSQLIKGVSPSHIGALVQAFANGMGPIGTAISYPLQGYLFDIGGPAYTSWSVLIALLVLYLVGLIGYIYIVEVDQISGDDLLEAASIEAGCKDRSIDSLRSSLEQIDDEDETELISDTSLSI